jgi:RHS repeat-associated protein
LNRVNFTTYRHDDETGLDYAQARYYDDSTSRFTSFDPINEQSERMGSPQALNFYDYVDNNPLARTDQRGTDWFRRSRDASSYDIMWLPGTNQTGWTHIETPYTFWTADYSALIQLTDQRGPKSYKTLFCRSSTRPSPTGKRAPKKDPDTVTWDELTLDQAITWYFDGVTDGFFGPMKWLYDQIVSIPGAIERYNAQYLADIEDIRATLKKSTVKGFLKAAVVSAKPLIAVAQLNLELVKGLGVAAKDITIFTTPLVLVYLNGLPPFLPGHSLHQTIYEMGRVHGGLLLALSMEWILRGVAANSAPMANYPESRIGGVTPPGEPANLQPPKPPSTPTVVPRKPDVALGIAGRHNMQLRAFAEKTGGTPYWDWQKVGLTEGPATGISAQAFGEAAEEALSNAGWIHFDLTFIGDDSAAAAAADLGENLGWGRNNMTNAELALIRSRPDFQAKTTWYRFGGEVANPFR